MGPSGAETDRERSLGRNDGGEDRLLALRAGGAALGGGRPGRAQPAVDGLVHRVVRAGALAAGDRAVEVADELRRRDAADTGRTAVEHVERQPAGGGHGAARPRDRRWRAGRLRHRRGGRGGAVGGGGGGGGGGGRPRGTGGRPGGGRRPGPGGPPARGGRPRRDGA